MIEKKIDNDTVIVGREIKISNLETRKANLEAQQTATQAERDAYEAQPEEIKSKMQPPIDFAYEIIEVTERIDKYKNASIEIIRPAPEPRGF
ncbi:MAG: hypothetical protein CMI54_06090 [Parcubacteria group bacterium]|jgi:hypothetical protein|nr:hypothetical protein [Parcubacteria group bacterium]|tara:strand:- start:2887 stop:3162 length:276 start_codon:yes stop_codon:yes gene_type:complete